MSWKYRANNRKPDTSTAIVLFIIFPAIIFLFFAWEETLFFGLFLLSFWILDKILNKSTKSNKSRIKELEEKLERIRLKLPSKNFDPNYKGSESYQALLRKYNGNIPGSGQGDNSGEKIGKRGGRFIKRISKKTGKSYRHYY